MTPQLVIFDCDGVLVDSETPSNAILSANLARHGLTLDPEGCAGAFAGLMMSAVGDKARAMGADLPAGWRDQIYAEIYARLRQGVPVIDGVPALLTHLEAAGVATAIGSNGSMEKMQITLGQSGLWDRFPGMIHSAHTLGIGKPAPDLYLGAASQAGVAPARAVVIEDSPAGATAAARAGMRCLGYAPDGNGMALEAVGATVFSHMSQVPGILGLA